MKIFKIRGTSFVNGGQMYLINLKKLRKKKHFICFSEIFAEKNIYILTDLRNKLCADGLDAPNKTGMKLVKNWERRSIFFFVTKKTSFFPQNVFFLNSKNKFCSWQYDPPFKTIRSEIGQELAKKKNHFHPKMTIFKIWGTSFVHGGQMHLINLSDVKLSKNWARRSILYAFPKFLQKKHVFFTKNMEILTNLRNKFCADGLDEPHKIIRNEIGEELREEHFLFFLTKKLIFSPKNENF